MACDEEEREYDDYVDDDPCDHEIADIDILTGRALCHLCGHAWWLNSDEFKAEIAYQAEQYEAMAEEHAVESALTQETKEE